MLVKMLPNKEIEQLRHQFQDIDWDKSGWIDADELSTAISEKQYFPKEMVDWIIKEVSILE